MDKYRSIMPLRILLLRESNPDFYKRLVYLMDHREERKKDEKMVMGEIVVPTIPLLNPF